MYLAYSALNLLNNDQQQSSQNNPDNELLLRYRAYQTTCAKYSREIAAIQQYLPGWVPKFR